MARTRSAPLSGRPKMRWNACWYSATAAICATAASRLGWPISTALTIGSAACSSSVLTRPSQNCVLLIEGVQNGRGIALANAAFDADGGPFPVGEGERGIMACAARDSAVDRQATVEEKFLAEGNFLRGLRIVRRDRGTCHCNRRANLLKRLRLR